MKKDKLRNFLLIILILITGLLIGILMNKAVISQNHGRMPVYYEQPLSSSTHFSYLNENEINLEFLTDKYYWGSKGTTYLFSLGDALIYFFGILLILFLDFGVFYLGFYAINLVKEKRLKSNLIKIKREIWIEH